MLGTSPLSEYKGQLLGLLQSTMEKAQPVTIIVAIAIIKDVLCIPGLLNHLQVRMSSPQSNA